MGLEEVISRAEEEGRINITPKKRHTIIDKIRNIVKKSIKWASISILAGAIFTGTVYKTKGIPFIYTDIYGKHYGVVLSLYSNFKPSSEFYGLNISIFSNLESAYLSGANITLLQWVSNSTLSKLSYFGGMIIYSGHNEINSSSIFSLGVMGYTDTSKMSIENTIIMAPLIEISDSKNSVISAIKSWVKESSKNTPQFSFLRYYPNDNKNYKN